MGLIVQKYGGSSVASVALMENHARRAMELREQGHQVVLVLSAMGDSTDRLNDLANSACPDPDPRELDALLATGEQVAVSVMAIVLRRLGCPARSYTGAQIGIRTESVPGKACITGVDTEVLSRDIDAGCIPVVAGFQGVDEQGNTTTIGRGGSDTTAVALAASLGADECQILTDVDGVYTTDPRMVPQARLLKHLTFEEMIELAGQGSRVLQNRAVEFASKYKVPLRVMSSFRPGSGTLISLQEADVEAPVVSGIAFNRDEAEITVTSIPDQPGMALQLLKPLSDARIDVDMIVLNAPRDGHVDISFTVHRQDHERAGELVRAAAKGMDGAAVRTEERVAKISVVGAGMRSHASVGATLLEALAEQGINLRILSTSEIRISVLVDEVRLEDGVRCLHDAFGLDQEPAARQG
ncbi:aspartate kinase [bacterium MnTg04]|nr:aspartate kinase [bacterium MnTg04]